MQGEQGELACAGGSRGSLRVPIAAIAADKVLGTVSQIELWADAGKERRACGWVQGRWVSGGSGEVEFAWWRSVVCASTGSRLVWAILIALLPVCLNIR